MRPTFEGVGEIRPVAVVASIVGLGTFAVAQPLLDLLGRNPEFFVARRFPAPDIWLLAAGLLLVPLVVACLILALRAVDRKSTRLNSSHVRTSYAVFCSKKKTIPARIVNALPDLECGLLSQLFVQDRTNAGVARLGLLGCGKLPRQPVTPTGHVPIVRER